MPEAALAKPIQRKKAMAPFVESSAQVSRSSERGAASGLPMFLQRTGNTGHAPAGVQTKLTVNQPGDEFEQEADAVAQIANGTATSQAGAVPISRRADGQVVQRQSAKLASVESLANSQGALQPPDSGSRLNYSIRERVEPILGADLGSVRVHTSSAAQETASELNARAFTNHNHIWLGPDQSADDVGLMAHEATHVAQQADGAPTARLQRQHDSTVPATQTDTGVALTDASRLAGRVTFDELRSCDLHVALLVEQLSADYRELVREIDPLLIRARIYDRPIPENVFQRTARERVFAAEDEISRRDQYDPVHLSLWLEAITPALQYLSPLLEALGRSPGPEARHAEDAELARRDALTLVRELTESPYIRSGVVERQRREQVERAEQRISDAVEYIQETLLRVWQPALSDIEGDMHGTVIASHLVHRMRLTADEIRDVFDALRTEDPRLLEAALMRGGTVRALLQMGIGGLQAYRAEGEGFLAGVIRGGRESRLAQQPGQRVFSAWERVIAVGGFIAGAFQGVGDSIISNVKGIVELFTPSFWRGMVNFVTRFLPRFIDNEEFRFQLGQMVGLFDANEERRLATAEPFEYGRTFGQVFGMAITEIVLTFIGLGFILKALNGSARLQRVARPLVSIAEGIARSAIAARGLRIVEVIAEAINALSRRLRRLTMLLPDFTPNARLRRTLFEMEEAERGIYEAYNRAQELERLAREALAAGNEEHAQQRLNELGAATDELERRVAGSSSTAPTGVTAPTESTGTVTGVGEPATAAPVVEHVPGDHVGSGGGHDTGGGERVGGYPSDPQAPDLERIAERYEEALVDHPNLMQRFEELERMPRNDPNRAAILAALETDLARVHGGGVPSRTRPEPLTSSDVERGARIGDPDVEGPTTVDMPTTLSVDELARFRDVVGRTERHHSFFRYLLGGIQRSRGQPRLPRHGPLVVLETPTHQAGLHDLWDAMYPQLARREGAAQEIADAIRRGDRLAETGEVLTPTVIADRLEQFYRDVGAAHPDMLSSQNLELILRRVRSIRQRAGF